MAVDEDWFSPEPDETVVWTGQPRVWRIWRTVGNALVVSVVALVVAYAVTTRVAVDLPPLPLPVALETVVWVVAGLVVVSQVGSAVFAYLRVEATDYVLTDRRVYRKQGVLSEHVSSVGIDRVQETTLSKDLFGNLFDYGTVAISTAGSGGADLALTDLDDPETFRDRLQEQVRARGTGGDGTGAGAAGTLDDATVDALLTEARGLRQVAERLEESV